MKKISIRWLVLAVLLTNFSATTVFAGGVVVITEPATGDTVSSPVKVCMAVDGIEVQPAKKGVNPGKGHHLLIDVDLPTDLSKRIGKDANHVHMGDGSLQGVEDGFWQACNSCLVCEWWTCAM